MSWFALSCFGLAGCLQWFNRSDLRAQYNLQGSGCGDCLRSVCCPCCALIQEEKEVLLRNEKGLGNANTPQVGYQAMPPQQAMVYDAKTPAVQV